MVSIMKQNKRGQLSVENIILVGIVLAILVPSVFLFYRSVSTAEATKGELQSIGTDLVSEIASMRTAGEGSWQTFTFSYKGAKGRLYTENGNELLISADTTYPFFLEREDNIVIEDGLMVTPGVNKIKITSQGDTLCLSSMEGVCDFTMCKDVDTDYYSWRGGGNCCGPTHDQPCNEVRDCNDQDGNVQPNTGELCDRKDNDCDGLIDEDFDADHDGYPAQGYSSQCSPAYIQFDCLDTDAQVHPGVQEICDGKDNDCFGGIDNSLGFISCQDSRAGSLLGLCADKHATCSAAHWVCDLLPGQNDENCNDAGLVDEDCDGFSNSADPGCQILFFSDYDIRADEVSGYDWLIADKCIGSCAPVDFSGVSVVQAQVPGVNDTSVRISNVGKLMYAADHNINPSIGTIEFWMRTTVPWNDGTYRTLLYFSNDKTGLLEQMIQLEKGGDNILKLNYVKDNTLKTILISSVVGWNQLEWFHVAVTWNTYVNPTRMNIYINGVVRVNDVVVDPLSWPASFDSPESFFTVGAKRSSSVYSNFGLVDIDDLLITPSEKTAGEILADYNRFPWDYYVACDAPGNRIGDVNKNGCVDGTDKPFIVSYLQGTYHPTNGTLACMDINQDHFVDQADVTAFVANKCTDCITGLMACQVGNPPRFCNDQGLWVNMCGGVGHCGCPSSYPLCMGSGTCSAGGGSPIFGKPPTEG